MEIHNEIMNEVLQIHRRIDEFVPLSQKVLTYGSEDFWQIPNPEFFSDKLLERIQETKVFLIEFIKGGYSQEFCENHNREFPFYRKLAYQISKHNNIIEGFLASRNWKAGIARSIATSLFQSECVLKKTIPVTQNQLEKTRIARRIHNAIISEKFNKYKEPTWEEYLEDTYGTYWPQMSELLKIDIESIINAFPYNIGEYLQKPIQFNMENESRCKENVWDTFFNSWGEDYIKVLFLLCQNGFYEASGIVSWHDLLYNCLNKEEIQKDRYFLWRSLHRTQKINQVFFNFLDVYSQGSISQRFCTRKGLEIVKRDIILFQELFGRTPTQFDFAYVLHFFENSYWQKYGITNWEALIQVCFPPKRELIKNERSSITSD